MGIASWSFTPSNLPWAYVAGREAAMESLRYFYDLVHVMRNFTLLVSGCLHTVFVDGYLFYSCLSFLLFTAFPRCPAARTSFISFASVHEFRQI